MLAVPRSYNVVRPIERGDDLLDIVGRVLDGDSAVGWRGDPCMDVYERRHEIAVYGFDREGNRYLAAVVDRATDPDWRHTLLRKLRDGDWQDENAIRRVIAANDALDRKNEEDLTNARLELAERVAFAIRRDNGYKDLF